jgi:hypothetical protein
MMECVKRMLPESAIVERREVLKNNGVKAIGLSIREEGNFVAPIIYLNEFYLGFCEGISIEELAEYLLDYAKAVPPIPVWNYEDIEDFTKVKDLVVYKLINAKRNQELLKNVPNLPLLDFAIVFYVMLPVNECERCSILIKNEHINYWELPISILYHYAKTNTQRICPYVLKPLAEVLEQKYDVLPSTTPLIILTNQTGVNGASAILYPEMPKQIFSYVGKNYYLLPSSIHEFLIVPEEEGVNPLDLKEIVKEVNENHLEQEEFLSDHIYYFDGNIITEM